LGTWRWKTVLRWGAAIGIFGALPWLLALIHESFLLIGFIAYPVLLVGCVVAAISDGRAKKAGGPWRNAKLPAATGRLTGYHVMRTDVGGHPYYQDMSPTVFRDGPF